MKKQKLHIKKGDNVLVLTGDSKGLKGKVLVVEPDKQTAIVEGVKMVSKHTKPNKENPQGGIIKKASPIHVSNLMVVDNTGKATRIGRKLDEKKNKLVRYSKKSGEVIR
ncbi:MAG: 50S ribosomal protein L24 [Bacteroidales bacterium]|jgi:large subunit ribosomal protein L24|nr:50S ribosomal protein L24 [Bacteroidales bacterium]MDI9592739.1 50S ribosomal protein L24 [Bacteroidota bacterium]NLH33524.1 50S ribosomal protein L24 [Lentimicrobium sp.]OQC37234.1 MAG: 50S ribosomal protein L24 [Bacteroidetes bacterium ADurb.Bin041]MBP7873738.1 50S ribosomal protein L24 [Bacteroidales bacterium]